MAGQVRLKDIAERAGVSRVAVGKVLLGSGGDRIRVGAETEALIRRVAAEMDYQPNVSAQTLAGKGSRTIGAVIDTFAPAVSYRRLAQLERALEAKGFLLLVGQAHDDPEKLLAYTQAFASRGIDGFVSFAHNYPEHREKLAGVFSRIPNTVFIEEPALSGCHYVKPDRDCEMAQSLQHLTGRGRKRVGLVLPFAGHAVGASKLAGYRKWVKILGLPPGYELVHMGGHVPDNLPGYAAAAARELALDRHADAVVAANDIHAAYLLKALRKLGVGVPDDIALIGSDNIDVCELTEPTLTSVDYNDGAIAEAAVDIVLRLIALGRPPEEPLTRTIKPKLVIREST